MILRSTLLVLFFILIKPVFSVKPDEIKEMLGRTFLVQIFDEQGDYPINEVQDYNEGIKQSFNDVWSADVKNIEFKTAKEINELIKKNPTNYTLVTLGEYNRKFDEVGHNFLDENAIRLLNITKAETKKSSYMFSMPDEGKNTTELPSSYDVIISLKMMKNHFDYILETNKDIKFIKYAQKVGESNCSKIGNDNLYIKETIAGKVSLTLKITSLSVSDYEKELGRTGVNVISAEEFGEIIKAGEDKIISIPVPESIAVSAATDAINRKMYFRLFVNAKTGEIMSYCGSTSTDNTEYFSLRDMKIIKKCK